MEVNKSWGTAIMGAWYFKRLLQQLPDGLPQHVGGDGRVCRATGDGHRRTSAARDGCGRELTHGGVGRLVIEM
ncbi:MAG TPA: hypothetical protein VHJ19_02310 [Gammaproteobacteria bacterium]|nr:hypothetical protein [Gammaproteobacteria bacterium]